MGKTERLYYEDPYMRSFTAKVVSCVQEKGRYTVELDRTAFYPEGGGQPADRGKLGCADVTDVHEKDGAVLHYCTAPLETGGTVEGTVDWERRFDHMQQHSGEHIVSGIICSRFGCSNVGFHMGADSVLIDYDAEITEEELQKLEDDANAYIWEDHAIEITWPSPEELEELDYRSKKELTGDVRIVRFPGADCCACCGTHVSRSGEVGLVKFISRQKFHDGVRLELLCGKRALAHLSAHRDQNLEVSRLLSAKWHSTGQAVERVMGELDAEKLRANVNEELYFRSIAAGYRGKGDVLIVTDPLSPDSTRKLCDLTASECGGRTAVFAGGAEGFKYAVMDSDDERLRETVKKINAALSGRGGGRGGLAQGSAACAAEQIKPLFLDCGWLLD